MTRVQRFRVASLLSCMLVSLTTYAQDQCRDILADGVFDREKRNWTYSYDSLNVRSICSLSDEKIRTSATIPIEGVTWDFKGDRDKLKKSCDKAKRRLTIDEADRSVLEKASGVIVGAWESCMQRNPMQHLFSLEQSGDRSRVLLHVRSGYVRADGKDEPLDAMITIPEELDTTSCQCDNLRFGTCAVKGNRVDLSLPEGSGVVIRCRRAQPHDILVRLSAQFMIPEARLPSVATPELVLLGKTVDLPGRCSNQNRKAQPQEFLLEARDIPGGSLDVKLRREGSTPAGDGGWNKDLFANCKDGYCETEINEPFWLSGDVGKQRIYGLWLDASADLGGSIQLIGQQGNRNCDHASMRIPSLKIGVRRVDTWKRK